MAINCDLCSKVNALFSRTAGKTRVANRFAGATAATILEDECVVFLELKSKVEIKTADKAFLPQLP